MMEYKNYIQVENKIPFRSSFCFIDSINYTSSGIFYAHELYGIRFSKTEFHKTDSEFIIAKCSIFTKDIDIFKECMQHLRRKLEFLDYDMNEYDKLSGFFSIIEENREKIYDEKS